MRFDLRQSARVVIACVLVTIFSVPPSLLAQVHVVSPADLQKEILNATQRREDPLESAGTREQRELSQNPPPDGACGG